MDSILDRDAKTRHLSNKHSLISETYSVLKLVKQGLKTSLCLLLCSFIKAQFCSFCFLTSLSFPLSISLPFLHFRPTIHIMPRFCAPAPLPLVSPTLDLVPVTKPLHITATELFQKHKSDYSLPSLQECLYLLSITFQGNISSG